MAFTQAQLQAQLDSEGNNCEITRFDAAGASATDVYVTNFNTNSSRKSGWTQIAQTQTAAQAYAAIKTQLTQ